MLEFFTWKWVVIMVGLFSIPIWLPKLEPMLEKLFSKGSDKLEDKKDG